MADARNVLITPLPAVSGPVEIVERKGRGHPDTICDALAETLSRNLCLYYLEHYGTILHHNVDKALLRGGSSYARFGGGNVTAPIDIYLAGRATTRVGSDIVPLEELVIEGSRRWLRDNFHALDAERDVRLHCLVRPGSADLRDVFARSDKQAVPLSNDTSIGVGYAPRSPLELSVLHAENRLTDHARDDVPPAWGEDVKIMGVASREGVQLTVATAMVCGFLEDASAYEFERQAVKSAVTKTARSNGLADVAVRVNAADDPEAGSYYLTVTGTSAESGDDGEVGRGNRANGLITPYRPMTLEAAAGKNPVNHVGKIYNAAAQRIAERICHECETVTEAHCFLVSEIGRPITEPAFVDVRIATAGGQMDDKLKTILRDLVNRELDDLPSLTRLFVDRTISVF